MEITILEKEGQFSVVSKQHTLSNDGEPFGTIVGFFQRNPQRANPVWYGRFDGVEEGNGAYSKAIKTSIEREWDIRYKGTQLNNPVYS